MDKKIPKTIKSLSEDDRPREKMLSKGKEALSNAELLAILLGSGNKQLNAVELSRLIFKSANHNINELAKYNLKELMEFSGIGPAKAVTISAALELGRRRKAELVQEINVIKDSESVYQILEPHLADLTIEEFWVIYLRNNNRVIHKKRFSIGGIAGTVVDKRLILKEALMHNATGMVLAHNHPSGNLTPSQQDLSLTKDLIEAAKFMDIRILDHIIITQAGYTSFRDEGYM